MLRDPWLEEIKKNPSRHHQFKRKSGIFFNLNQETHGNWINSDIQ